MARLLLLFVAALSMTPQQRLAAIGVDPTYQVDPPMAQYHYHKGAGTLEVPMPDPDVTPGAADPQLTKEKLCSKSFHTGTVRNVTEHEKLTVCHNYGLSLGCPGRGYELDHLISIELGGSNEPSNLWPQPVDEGGVIGFHTKDKVENALHRMVCDGKLTLRDAQKGIADDWYQYGIDNHIIDAKGNLIK